MAAATIFMMVVGICLSGVQAQIRFANIYGNQMVLQQAPAQAIVWGYAPKCDSKLTVTFNQKSMEPTSTTNPANNMCIWKAELPATPADAKSMYTITVSSDKYGQASITNVMFGDVWICSGQSNMAFTVSQAYNSADEIADSVNYPLIHLFTPIRNYSTSPLEEVANVTLPWTPAKPTNLGSFSAACWFFAKNLFKSQMYPIGLVHSSWGGTPIEAWSSPDSLSNCGSEQKSRKPKAPPKIDQHTPSVLWNAMIRPFVNMTMKGALWYQGENNANSANPGSYSCTFPSMIDDWREKWFNGTNNQTTPFYFGFAQLAPVGTTNTTIGGFPIVRWAQTAGYGYVPNPRMKDVFMAVTIDLGDPTSPYGNIHPRDKQDVGLRLATGARSVVYNDSKAYYLGMLPQKAEISTGSSADVTAVSIAYGPADPRGKLELRYPYGFEIGCADPSGKTNTTWVEGTAKSVTDSAVNVEFPLCAAGLKPGSVRYCWRADPCTFNKCPIYTSTINTSPPFMMNLK